MVVHCIFHFRNAKKLKHDLYTKEMHYDLACESGVTLRATIFPNIIELDKI